MDYSTHHVLLYLRFVPALPQIHYSAIFLISYLHEYSPFSCTSSICLPSLVPSILDRCPPFILQEPEKLIQVSAGDQAVLNLYVRACPPPTFAWYRNTIELSYATESTLVIPRMSTHTAGQYTCTITNDLGSIITGPYTLQLVRKPSFPELASECCLGSIV